MVRVDTPLHQKRLVSHVLDLIILAVIQTLSVGVVVERHPTLMISGYKGATCVALVCLFQRVVVDWFTNIY